MLAGNGLRVEQARGISPQASHRTVLEPLSLYGSCYTNLCANSIKPRAPLVKQIRKLFPCALSPGGIPHCRLCLRKNLKIRRSFTGSKHRKQFCNGEYSQGPAAFRNCRPFIFLFIVARSYFRQSIVFLNFEMVSST